MTSSITNIFIEKEKIAEKKAQVERILDQLEDSISIMKETEKIVRAIRLELENAGNSINEESKNIKTLSNFEEVEVSHQVRIMQYLETCGIEKVVKDDDIFFEIKLT